MRRHRVTASKRLQNETRQLCSGGHCATSCLDRNNFTSTTEASGLTPTKNRAVAKRCFRSLSFRCLSVTNGWCPMETAWALRHADPTALGHGLGPHGLSTVRGHPTKCSPAIIQVTTPRGRSSQRRMATDVPPRGGGAVGFHSRGSRSEGNTKKIGP